MRTARAIDNSIRGWRENAKNRKERGAIDLLFYTSDLDVL
jgi:hypothetical protein